MCNVFLLANCLANCFANYKLQVKTGGQTIQNDPTPKYLGVNLDQTLSFKQHLLNIAAKTTKRISLMKRLASSHRGAYSTTLRTTALALCFLVAEYCSPVWCHSGHCHKLDSSLNECLRLISRCIKSTPTYLLPVSRGIEPADIRRNKNCINLYKRAADASHNLHNLLYNPAPAVPPKSRNPLTSRV